MSIGKRIQEALYDGRKGPAIFLLAAFLLGLSVNLISSWADAFLKDCYSPWWWFWVLLGPILFLFVSSRWWSALFTEVDGSLPGVAQKRKGLVVLASPGEGIQNARRAIEHHLSALETVWILYSQGTPISSQEAALKLIADLIDGRLLRTDQIRDIPLSTEDFQDPQKVKDVIEERVYGDLPGGLQEGDVVIDITGGLKTTTAGAFLAGLPKGRHLQINIPAEMNTRGQGIEPGIPWEIRIDYHLRRARKQR